jgi:endonuclease YncB( thermonuclease family)
MRLRLLLSAILALASVTPSSANWIVFARGGMQEIRGVIEVRGNQVLFRSPAGALLSARLEDVDVPASAFLTWQVGDGRKLPAAPPAQVPSAGRPAPPAAPPCVTSRVAAVVNAETLKIETAGRVEVVHLACVDGPDLRHKFPDLDWYGRVAMAAVEALAPAGAAVCVGEDTPPRRDVEGHRIVYARAPGGADLGAEVVARGLGVVRSETCARLESYRAAERGARQAGRGHWGPEASAPSLAIAVNALALTGGPGVAPYGGVRSSGGG